MIYKTIDFTEDGRVSLDFFLHGTSPAIPSRDLRPAVLIFPGGGYTGVSDREAQPVALAFMARGYHAFVLRYSVGAFARYPAPQLDAFRALKLIRNNAQEWGIYPDRVAVCGFSAGGHLAASTGVLWKDPEICEALQTQPREIRPDALILSYPVITSGEFAHRGSFNNLLGTEPAADLLRHTSAELCVDADTPPAFIWHTGDDSCVPVENALLMASALRRNSVPFELHIYESGPHGLSLCTAETGMLAPRCENWLDMADSWLGVRFA